MRSTTMSSHRAEFAWCSYIYARTVTVMQHGGDFWYKSGMEASSLLPMKSYRRVRSTMHGRAYI